MTRQPGCSNLASDCGRQGSASRASDDAGRGLTKGAVWAEAPLPTPFTSVTEASLNPFSSKMDV